MPVKVSGCKLVNLHLHLKWKRYQASGTQLAVETQTMDCNCIFVCILSTAITNTHLSRVRRFDAPPRRGGGESHNISLPHSRESSTLTSPHPILKKHIFSFVFLYFQHVQPSFKKKKKCIAHTGILTWSPSFSKSAIILSPSFMIVPSGTWKNKSRPDKINWGLYNAAHCPPVGLVKWT